MIKTDLTKRYGSGRRGRCQLHGHGRWLFGAERRGQDHHHAHARGLRIPHCRSASICGYDVVNDARRWPASVTAQGAPSRRDDLARLSSFIADVRGLEGARRQARAGRRAPAARRVQEQTMTLPGFPASVGLAQAIVHDRRCHPRQPTDARLTEARGAHADQRDGADKIIVISTHILKRSMRCTRAVSSPAAASSRTTPVFRGAPALPQCRIDAGSRHRRSWRRHALRWSALPMASVEVSERDNRLTALPRSAARSWRRSRSWARSRESACRICTWNRDASMRCCARSPLEEPTHHA